MNSIADDEAVKMGEVLVKLESIGGRLAKMEETLEKLAEQKMVRDWYSTREIAAILRREEYTVREWCRLARINAIKQRGGRGNEGEWRVSHDELLRYQREGLLPLTPQAHLRW